MLLDGSLGDHELVGDRAGRRGLGEHVAVEQRATKGEEDVAFARGQRWGSGLDFGLGSAGADRVAEDEPRLAEPDLVTVAQTP